MASATHKVLLVEFLHDDVFNQHRTETFPFLQGLLRSRNVPVRWVSIVAGRDCRPEGPWIVEPPNADRGHLVAAARTFDPTHVIANETLGRQLLADLHRACPDAHVIPPTSDLLRLGLHAALERVLGLTAAPSDGPETVFDAATPDFDAHLLAGAAPVPSFLTPIVAGPSCVYRRSLAGNPHFAAVPLEGLPFPDGCTFCVNPPGMRRGIRSRDPVDLALLQLRRFMDTAPHFRRTGRFLVDGIQVFRRLPEFLEAVQALELPPSAFFFSCRVDEVLERADDLRRWLPRLADRGHGLHLWNVGLENFSPVENARFNKGLSPDQIETVIGLLDGLESDFPGRFGFREHGGFGLILFTPWTRILDLEQNVQALNRHHCRGDLGPVTSRLQLRPGTPLEALARQDRLVDEAAELAAVPRDASCLTEPGDWDIPWRFANRDVQKIWSVLAGWYVEVRPEGLPPRPETSALEALEALLTLQREQPDLDEASLACRAAERLRPPPAAPAQPDGPTVGAPWIAHLIRLVDLATRGGTQPLVGYRVERIESRLDGEAPFAEIACSRDDDQVVLHILRAPEAPAFLRVGDFGVRYRSDTPIDRPSRVRLAQTIGRLLAGCARTDPPPTAPPPGR